MVLDENALEAMLARQRNAERGHRPQGSVRTEKTSDFEVYERKDPEAAPAQEAPPAPPRRAHAPLRAPAPRDEGASDFEELPGRHTSPGPADSPEAPRAQPAPRPPTWQPPEVTTPPAPVKAPPPAPEAVPQVPPPAPEAVPQVPPPAPEAVPQVPPAAATQAPETMQEPVQETRRPQVWPPIQPKAPAASPADARPAPLPSDPAPTAAPQAADPAARTHAPAPAEPSGASNGSGCRIAIVQAMFNQEITQQMADAAKAHAKRTGAEVRHQVPVPGVFDLPLTTQTLARRKDVDAVVVIGCVIQGETDHDDLITFTTAKTLQEISLATQTPVGLGIIGPGMTWEQAQARVGNGAHAVDAVIAQWRLLQTV